VTAGVLLCACRLTKSLGLAMPAVADVLAATGGKHSRAYEIARAIEELLPTLGRPVRRPRVQRAEPPASKLDEIRGEALRFVMTHPGCVRLGDERGRYAETWRRFVIELRERHVDVPLSALADAICMPLGTVEDWLRFASPTREERSP